MLEFSCVVWVERAVCSWLLAYTTSKAEEMAKTKSGSGFFVWREITGVSLFSEPFWT